MMTAGLGELRRQLEDAIETGIAVLDALDAADEDREDDEREPEDPREQDADDEPVLGWPNDFMAVDGGAWLTGEHEPSLGWTAGEASSGTYSDLGRLGRADDYAVAGDEGGEA